VGSVDKITGNYRLETLDNACGEGDITITAACGHGKITLNGNLYVIGSVASIESTVTKVNDNYIRVSTLVKGEPLMHAGLQVERGDEATLEVRWNENIRRWEFTENGINFLPILGRVIQDTQPVLGGDLRTGDAELGCKIIKSDYPCNIVLSPGVDRSRPRGGVEIREVYVTDEPNHNPGSATVFAKPVQNCGDTGLFVKLSQGEQQLTAKRWAAVLSLVL